jgi:hypothetical protein
MSVFSARGTRAVKKLLGRGRGCGYPEVILKLHLCRVPLHHRALLHGPGASHRNLPTAEGGRGARRYASTLNKLECFKQAITLIEYISMG